MVAFLRWLSGTVMASLYPGAPHARQQAALELLTLLLDAWGSQVRCMRKPCAVAHWHCGPEYGPKRYKCCFVRTEYPNMQDRTPKQN